MLYTNKYTAFVLGCQHLPRWTQVPGSATISVQGAALVLCCGPGRHAIALAKRGIDVTAVDLTAHYLEMLRGNLRRGLLWAAIIGILYE